MSARDDYAKMMADAAPDVCRRLGICPNCADDSEPKGSGNLCRRCRKAEELTADQFVEHSKETLRRQRK